MTNAQLRAELNAWIAHRLWRRHQRLMQKERRFREKRRVIIRGMVKRQKRAKELRG